MCSDSLSQATMKARLEERARIARELHDTLLQSIQGLILTVQSYIGHLSRRDPMRDRLERTLDQANDLLNAARDRVMDLRNSHLATELPAALESLAERIDDAAGKCSIEVRGTPRRLQARAAWAVLNVAREALSNARSHSAARTIEIELTYAQRHLSLRVRDDGRGFDLNSLLCRDPGPHYGLMGMRERASELGGDLQIASARDIGTELTLRVPSRSAYRMSASGAGGIPSASDCPVNLPDHARIPKWAAAPG